MLPRPVFGGIVITINIGGEIPHLVKKDESIEIGGYPVNIFIPWLNFDWLPAMKPYSIG